MKCPKCGSEKVDYKYHKTPLSQKYDEMYCIVCHHEYKNYEKYQARLDKVLSKFEDYNDDIPRLRISQSTNDVYVIHIKDQKRFATRGLTLSLKTVESLLEDLEEATNE